MTITLSCFEELLSILINKTPYHGALCMKLIPVARSCQRVAASNFKETKKVLLLTDLFLAHLFFTNSMSLMLSEGLLQVQNFLWYMKDVREVTRCGTRAESQESIACRKRSMWYTIGLKLKADVTRSQNYRHQWPLKTTVMLC